MADSSLFDIDSTLPDLNELLQRYPTAYTTSTTSAASTASAASAASTAPVRKPGDRQSNPIEVLDTPPPLRQVASAAWCEVPQAPSTPSWLRRPWYTGVESSAQASTQEPFSPLPPPRTPPPSGHECCAASASLVYDTNDPPQWLQSPSPEVKI
jgi:hypothetical protein